tara:strand:+ start:3013 stop:3249 length:237 start_codon:yes stop_codon:yes gene_type:complete
MIFKNGRLFHTPSVLRKRPINKSGRLIFKNGRLFHKLGFEKIITVRGFTQKIISISFSSVNKIIGVARTSIEKVIGAN